MIGEDKSSPGRPQEVTDEELLNVIRQSEKEEIPTPDVADADDIPIDTERVRQRLKQLKEEGRVKSRMIGQTQIWWLSELETNAPVQHTEVAKLHRFKNMLTDVGRSTFYTAAGCMFASVMLFIIFLHGNAGQISPPILSSDDILLAAYLIAYVGTALAIVSGTLYGVGTGTPKVVEWWLYWQMDREEHPAKEK